MQGEKVGKQWIGENISTPEYDLFRRVPARWARRSCSAPWPAAVQGGRRAETPVAPPAGRTARCRAATAEVRGHEYAKK